MYEHVHHHDGIRLGAELLYKQESTLVIVCFWGRYLDRRCVFSYLAREFESYNKLLVATTWVKSGYSGLDHHSHWLNCDMRLCGHDSYIGACKPNHSKHKENKLVIIESRISLTGWSIRNRPYRCTNSYDRYDNPQSH